MKQIYQPELGQIYFGQPWQEIEASEKVINALVAMQNLWYIFKKDDDCPFDNTGAKYKGKKFEIHAYSWSEEEEQEFNFKWRDIKISWYKCLGRGTTINRKMKHREVEEMLMEYVKEFKK